MTKMNRFLWGVAEIYICIHLERAREAVSYDWQASKMSSEWIDDTLGISTARRALQELRPNLWPR